jgi:hypothetical protein
MSREVSLPLVSDNYRTWLIRDGAVVPRLGAQTVDNAREKIWAVRMNTIAEVSNSSIARYTRQPFSTAGT